MLFKFLTVASVGVTILTIQAINSDETSLSRAALGQKDADIQMRSNELPAQTALLNQEQKQENVINSDKAAKIDVPKDKIEKSIKPVHSKKKVTQSKKPVIHHSYLPPRRLIDTDPQIEDPKRTYKTYKKPNKNKITRKTRLAKIKQARRRAYLRYRKREAARQRAIRRYYRNMYRYDYY